MVLHFLYNIGSWSYRRIVTLMTILTIIFGLILATLFWTLTVIIFPFVLIILGLVWSGLWWSKRNTEKGVKWTLQGMYQQFNDWKAGRKLRKDKNFTENYLPKRYN